MHFQTVALLAMSTAAAAQTSTSSFNIESALKVLQTAIPASLVALYETNAAAATSVIESEFSHTETPSWFTALPSDIQTFLDPVTSDGANATSAESAVSAAITSFLASITSSASHAANTSAIAYDSTSGQSSISSSLASQNASYSSAATSSKSSSGMTTTSSSGSGSGSGATAGGSSSTTSSSKAGAMPTAVYGVSVAGFAGLVGIMAL